MKRHKRLWITSIKTWTYSLLRVDYIYFFHRPSSLNAQIWSSNSSLVSQWSPIHIHMVEASLFDRFCVLPSLLVCEHSLVRIRRWMQCMEQTQLKQLQGMSFGRKTSWWGFSTKKNCLKKIGLWSILFIISVFHHISRYFWKIQFNLNAMSLLSIWMEICFVYMHDTHTHIADNK